MEQPDYVEHRRAYQRAYYLAHREAKIAYARTRLSEHREEINARRRKAKEELRYTPRGIGSGSDANRRYHKEVMVERLLRERIRTLQVVSGQARPTCRACGERDILCLTINHRNGNGRKEGRSLSHRAFLLAIRSGARSTDDLEVLCQNCNIRYEYERGARHLPRGWESLVDEEAVAWQSGRSTL